MKRDEQHRKVFSLRDYMKEMTGQEREAFEMVMKRDRDDEDLDAISLSELNKLHTKYVVRKSKEELEERWKNITGS